MQVTPILGRDRISPIPAKLLVLSDVAPDCRFELRVERDLTSEEWDLLFKYLSILRRSANRKKQVTEGSTR